MIKKCPICKHEFQGSPRKKYCSKKCKKNYENSLRSGPKKKEQKATRRVIGRVYYLPSGGITRPQGLNEIASAFWDKVAPMVQERGHLNILSEDAFAELCDLFSRLKDITRAINETNRSLLQVDDKWDNKEGVETQSFKESALSDLKRKYSKQFLDYCKEFYLTPRVNRGNFGLLEDGDKDNGKKDVKERFFQD